MPDLKFPFSISIVLELMLLIDLTSFPNRSKILTLKFLNDRSELISMVAEELVGFGYTLIIAVLLLIASIPVVTSGVASQIVAFIINRSWLPAASVIQPS